MTPVKPDNRHVSFVGERTMYSGTDNLHRIQFDYSRRQFIQDNSVLIIIHQHLQILEIPRINQSKNTISWATFKMT